MLKIPEGSPIQIFRHCDTSKTSFSIFFFEISLEFPNGAPSIFLLLFSNKVEFQKAQRVPFFTTSKTSRFLSLRCSADFDRCRLVQTSVEKGGGGGGLTGAVVVCRTEVGGVQQPGGGVVLLQRPHLPAALWPHHLRLPRHPTDLLDSVRPQRTDQTTGVRRCFLGSLSLCLQQQERGTKRNAIKYMYLHILIAQICSYLTTLLIG